MDIQRVPRTPPVLPEAEQIDLRKKASPTSPLTDSGEFAKRMKAMFKRAGYPVQKPHVDKHSDYWMG